MAIPKWTKIESKDGKVIFRSNENTVIPAGEEIVDIGGTAETAGTIGNGYLAGEISKLLSPLAYIDKVENITISEGGSDIESDERLRERIKVAPESFSNAGSRGAYRYWAMTAHQDIVDVAILSPEPGVVKVYPLWS